MAETYANNLELATSSTAPVNDSCTSTLLSSTISGTIPQTTSEKCTLYSELL